MKHKEEKRDDIHTNRAEEAYIAAVSGELKDLLPEEDTSADEMSEDMEASALSEGNMEETIAPVRYISREEMGFTADDEEETDSVPEDTSVPVVQYISNPKEENEEEETVREVKPAEKVVQEKKKARQKKDGSWKKTACIVAGVILVCAIGVGGWLFSRVQNVLASTDIYEGISVSGISLSGMSKEEAENCLSEHFSQKMSTEKITLHYGEETREILFSDIDAGYHIEEVVDEAYRYAREGDTVSRFFDGLTLIRQGVDFSADFSYDASKLTEILQGIAEELDHEPKDSTMYKENGKLVVVPEENGTVMDVEKTAAAVEAVLFTQTSGEADVVVTEAEPEITAEMLSSVTDLIGSFYTTYNNADANRNTNLRVGCENLNGSIIMPGEVFSVTEALGPQTYANGYRSAGVYVNGKVESGMGGGVCQISTTVYNAVIMAELEIVERFPHSMTVGYVPLGRDAAIADNYKDFQFRNNTDTPIYLEAYAANNKLVINLYGKEIHDPGRTVEYETVYEATIPKPAEIVTEDPELPEGTREVTYTGKTGCKVSVYKKVYQDGALVSREWFNSSSYRATADEVTVGTKKAETAETTENTTNTSENTITTDPSAADQMQTGQDGTQIPEGLPVPETTE